MPNMKTTSVCLQLCNIFGTVLPIHIHIPVICPCNDMIYALISTLFFPSLSLEKVPGVIVTGNDVDLSQYSIM